MTHLPRFRARPGNVAVFVAISMVVFLGLVALAVDLGAFWNARSEARRAADAGALAAMGALIQNPGDVAGARAAAAMYAAENHVRNGSNALQGGDIVVNMGTDTTVSVSIVRSAARGNGIPTLFAGALGVHTFDVQATTTAGSGQASGVNCLRPFIVPDAFDDANHNGHYDAGETYNSATTGYGSDWRHDGYNHDVGREVVLYAGSSGAVVPSWYMLYNLPGQNGGNDIRAQISNTACVPYIGHVGDVYRTAQGVKNGPVNQGIQDLMSGDPTATWNPVTHRIENSRYGDAWALSPRVVRIPLFDPRTPLASGQNDLTVTNFATLFIELNSSGTITGRLLPVTGVLDDPNCNTTHRCVPWSRYPRIVR